MDGGTFDDGSFFLTSCPSMAHLSTPPTILFGIAHDTTFQSITHLTITYYQYPLSNPSRYNLIIRLFPQLTHFAGINTNGIEFYKKLLQDYGAQLVMVVVRVYNLWDGDIISQIRETRKEDTRMYVIELNPLNPEDRWLEDANGEDSVWERAKQETPQYLLEAEADEV